MFDLERARPESAQPDTRSSSPEAPAARTVTSQAPRGSADPGDAGPVTGMFGDAVNTGIFAGAEGGGQPLPDDLRGRFEQSLGADLSSVRIHTGDASASAATSLSAHAFAVGSDVHFAAGQYAPGDPAGAHLLAHEVAHTVQQRGQPAGAQAKLETSSPGDAAEHEADRAADAMISGAPAEVTAAPTARISRFASSEHREIGAAASQNRTLDLMQLDDGTTLTYGDMVALAGDYFGSIEEMRGLIARGPQGQIEVRCARDLSSGRPTTGFPPDVVSRVRARSNNLSVRNNNHFQQGGAPATYEDGHTNALRLAFHAAVARSQGNPPSQDLQHAFETEGFANHFLTDMFSAGHVRTPRTAIVDWYNANYPTSAVDIREYLVHYLVAYTNHQGGAVTLLPDSVLMSRIRDRLRAAAGPVLDAMSLGQIISLAHHNADGQGLNVQSAVDASGQPSTATWHDVGDGQLHAPGGADTMARVTAAARVSHDEVVAMSQRNVSISATNPDRHQEMVDRAFDQALASMRPFRALAYVPHEAPGQNPTMDWHWTTLSAPMTAAIEAALEHEVAGNIRAQAASQPVSASGVPVRAALNAFADMISTDRIGALRRALAHDYNFQIPDATDATAAPPAAGEAPAPPPPPPVVDRPAGVR